MQIRMFGGVRKPIEDKWKDIFKQVGKEAIAREILQCYTGKEGKEQIDIPKNAKRKQGTPSESTVMGV